MGPGEGTPPLSQPDDSNSSPSVARSRRWQATLVCVLAILLTLVYHFLGDSTPWTSWIAVGPSIVWAVLLLPAAVRSRSWLAFGFLSGFLLLTMEWPRLGTKETARDSLRLISWNIGAGNYSWSRALEAYAPDIVLVQESTIPPQDGWDGFDWYGTMDPGVLTRFPAEVLPTHTVGPWTDPQLLSVKMEGKTIVVANVRLMLPAAVMQIVDPFHQSLIANHRERVGQYERLATLVKTAADEVGAHAIILAGDFNVPARMGSLDPLRSFLRDAWLLAGSGWGSTVPEFLPLVRIDQVWLAGGIQPVAAKVVRLDGSDHRGLVVDFVLN